MTLPTSDDMDHRPSRPSHARLAEVGSGVGNPSALIRIQLEFARLGISASHLDQKEGSRRLTLLCDLRNPSSWRVVRDCLGFKYKCMYIKSKHHEHKSLNTSASNRIQEVTLSLCFQNMNCGGSGLSLNEML